MSILRRLILSAAFTALTSTCFAQTYPDKIVSIIVPAAPGGTTDFTARILGEYLTRSLGKSFVIENVGGGSGNLGNTRVAKAEPNGYTLLLSYSGYHVANPHLFKSPGWDAVNSFEPVALVLKAPHVIAVKKDLPVTDLKSFIAYAKANPTKLNYASSGIGSIQHIGTEQLKLAANINMLHIPYRGAAPAMTDLLGGQVDFFMTTPPAVVGFMKEGSVKTLALAAKNRHPAMPDVPTATEAGLANFELVAWFGLYAPAGTPKEVINLLSKHIEEITKNPEFIARVDKVGAYTAYLNPEQLKVFTKTELDFWGNVISKANIKVE